jgi:hypothetical protein
MYDIKNLDFCLPQKYISTCETFIANVTKL